MVELASKMVVEINGERDSGAISLPLQGSQCTGDLNLNSQGGVVNHHALDGDRLETNAGARATMRR